MTRTSFVTGICVAAALSGGAALAYEICWARALVVPLGNSADASAMVLAGFMLGMAAGARLGGGVAERARSPMQVYALVELMLGVYAIVAPRLLSSLSRVDSQWTGGAETAAVLRHLAALLLVATPGVAMGTTIPLLVRALVGPRGSLRRQIGVVYGVNTAGAAVAALAAGFWGIAELGVERSCHVAAAASWGAAAVGYVVHLIARRRGVPTMEAIADVPRGHGVVSTRARQTALVAAFVAGWCMLACEVLWARVLTFVFGHDTYAFASLLAYVLVGLSLGGLLHRLTARADQVSVLAVLLAGFALSTLASFWVACDAVVRLGRDPFGLAAEGTMTSSVWLELYRELAYTPILLLLPSVLAGAIFPAACSVYGSRADDAGRKVGIVGLVNGIGAAAGAAAATLVLVGVAGIQGGLVVLALVSAIMASAVLACRADRRGPGATAMAIAPLAATFVTAVLMPSDLPRSMLMRAVGRHHQRLLYYEEARTSTVSVIEDRIHGEKQLWINAVNEVTTRLVHDQSFKLLGHLGPLLHPRPKTAVMICLGAGLSAGAALTHPLERLDVVDLSSAVQRGAKHFEEENNGVLDHPAFRLHIDDGRQFLIDSPGGYDLAIVDSTHPKAVDSWILYTLEFYQLLRARLAPGGIAVQWLPLHGLSERELKVIVRTFLEGFPDMTLWVTAGVEIYGQVAYAKLVGFERGPVSIDVARMKRRLAEVAVKADLAPFGMDAVEEVLDQFVGGSAQVEAWTRGLPVQTDDHPIVPYTTELSGGRPMTGELLLGARAPSVPTALGSPRQRRALEEARRAQEMVLAGDLDRALVERPRGKKLALYREQARRTHGYYLALAQHYPDDADKLFEIGTQLANVGFHNDARRVLEAALALAPGDFRARLNLALTLADQGEQQDALSILSRLRSESPGSPVVHINLGLLALHGGDAGVAREHFQAAVAADPDHVGARLGLSRAALASDRLDEASDQLRWLLARNEWLQHAHHLSGVVATRRGDHEVAVTHHAAAVRLAPYDASFWYHLGAAHFAVGRLEQAAAAHDEALALEPDSGQALNALGRVRAAQGRYEDAAELQVRALEVAPGFADAAFDLGVALREQGRAHEAVGAFCLALQLQPSMVPARLQLAELGETSCGG